MWLQRFTNYLLQHRWQALLLTFVITFIPVVGIVGVLIAALMTLTMGLLEGALFTLAASLPFLLSFLVSEAGGETTSLVLWAAVAIAIISNVLTWAFASMLYKKASWATILQVAALVGVLAVSVVHLAYPNVSDWWGTQLRSYYNRAATMAEALDDKTLANQTSVSTSKAGLTGGPKAAEKPTAEKVSEQPAIEQPAVKKLTAEQPGIEQPAVEKLTAEKPAAGKVAEKPSDAAAGQSVAEQNAAQLETVNVTKQYATGMLVAVVLFNAIMQLILARWWQGLVFKPPLLRKELHIIRLSQLAGVLFVMAMVLWYLGNSVVVDMVPVVCLLFAGAGLSLIHYLFGLIDSPSSWFWLVLLYVTLIFASPFSVFLLALLALFDVWFDLRKRMRKI